MASSSKIAHELDSILERGREKQSAGRGVVGQRIHREQYGAGRPGGLLFWPQHLLGELVTRPPGAVTTAPLCEPAEQLGSLIAFACRQKCQGQLTRLRHRRPGLMVLAAAANARLDKLRPPFCQSIFSLLAYNPSCQDGVEPIHRIAGFTLPGAIEPLRAMPQRLPESSPRFAPRCRRVSELVRDQNRALQGFIDRATARHQSVPQRPTAGVNRPIDLALGTLIAEQKRDRF